MADVDEAGGQVSGLYTMILMDSLGNRLSADDLSELLGRASETRSIEDLKDMSSWTSFDQFKRLLQEASRSLDSAFQTVGVHFSSTVAAEIMQAFDSPGAVLRGGDGINILVPMRRYEMAELTPNEWTLASGSSKVLHPTPSSVPSWRASTP